MDLLFGLEKLMSIISGGKNSIIQANETFLYHTKYKTIQICCVEILDSQDS